jgi:nitroreductase
MELSAAIKGRRSTRSFTATPVDERDLRELVDAATFAPSAMNEQPCRFAIVTSKTLLNEISLQARGYALEEFGQESHIDHVRQMLTDSTFDIFYGAPALIVISAPTSSRWAAEDCALAAENLMLAAHAKSLRTCWIGFAQAWLGTDGGHRAIGLETRYTPVAPIIVGHAKTAMPPVSRREPHIDWFR